MTVWARWSGAGLTFILILKFDDLSQISDVVLRGLTDESNYYRSIMIKDRLLKKEGTQPGTPKSKERL